MSEKIVFDPKYAAGDLHEFNHWKLVISFAQHTLGSFIIFATRPVEKFSELTPSELTELTTVMKIMEQALVKLFQPDRFNYLQLGNFFHNLHFHGIPRYQQSRHFGGKEWVDATFGHMPVTDFKTQVSEEHILELKKAILSSLII